MQITIPDRILEAIEQGEALKMSKFTWKYSATLIDTNTAKTHGRPAATPQEALDNLNGVLPLRMRKNNTYGAAGELLKAAAFFDPLNARILDDLIKKKGGDQ